MRPTPVQQVVLALSPRTADAVRDALDPLVGDDELLAKVVVEIDSQLGRGTPPDAPTDIAQAMAKAGAKAVRAVAA
jgi:hypothetical protein